MKGKEERKRDKKEEKRRREREGSGKLLSEGMCKTGINQFNAILLFPHSW